MAEDRTPDGRDLVGVILAAGKGTRIAPFSERWPKPMLPILGKPLIQYQIESLRNLGVQRILIVVGHLGDVITSALGDGSRFGVRLDYVKQSATLGIAHALAQTEGHIDSPFLLLLGDIFFIHDDLRSMTRLLGPSDVRGVLAVKEEPSLEAIRRNYVAMEDANGFVRRVVEKPRHPRTKLKGCGIYLFDPSFFDAVRRTPRTAMRDEYELTDAIQIFIDDGARVRTARVIREDLNLTHPEDLLDVNLRLLDSVTAGDAEGVFGNPSGHITDTGSWFGSDVHVSGDARVRRSVLMDGVRVDGPVEIRDSLIFPGIHITDPTPLVRIIHTGDRILPCP